MAAPTPRRRLPPQACDSHMHVFGPPARYPGAPARLYSPPDMPVAAYAGVAAGLGLERVVLVQPSAYGSDNRCLLDTLRASDRPMRGVVVIDPALPDAELHAMHALGVRGVRLNLMTPRIGDAAAAERLLAPVAARIGALGWHIQIYADPGILAPIASVLGGLGVPVVLDHMTGVRVPTTSDDPQFAVLLDLLAAGRCWMKLSGADILARRDDDFSAAAPFARALVAANPARLVWGTDWPHLVHFHGAAGDAAPQAGYRPVDEPGLVDLLADVAGDDATLHRILVDNPQELYGF